MLELMKLEMQKFKIKKYAVTATIINIVILTLISIGALLQTKLIQANTASFNQNFLDSMKIQITAPAVIFSAILISKLIISEFTNKTISLLFLYPISRAKIIISKVLVVVSFSFISICVFSVIDKVILVLVGTFLNVMTLESATVFNFSWIISTLITAVTYSLIGLIPIYFGMLKKSVPTTIITALIVVAITHGSVSTNSQSSSLYNNLTVNAIIALIGVLVTYLTIKKIEKLEL